MTTTTEWTSEEVAALREHYPSHGPGWSGWARLAPGRSYNAIKDKARCLGVLSHTRRQWTSAEVARAAEMLDEGMTHERIAQELGRSRSAVSCEASKLRRQSAMPAPEPREWHRLGINDRAAQLIEAKHLSPQELFDVYGLCRADLSEAMGKD